MLRRCSCGGTFQPEHQDVDFFVRRCDGCGRIVGQRKRQPRSNLAIRQDVIKRMIGQHVEVIALDGTYTPVGDESISLYVPLPEYGVALKLPKKGS